jgi:hypothetical protein
LEFQPISAAFVCLDCFFHTEIGLLLLVFALLLTPPPTLTIHNL